VTSRLSRLRRRPLLVNVRTVLDRVPFRPLDVNCLYFLEFDGVPAPHANLLRGRAEVRTASVDDLDGLTKCQNVRRAFLNRFAAHDRCAVAVLDGRIIGYQWYCDRPVYFEERYSYAIEIASDAIYAYDIFILPEYRLAGLRFRFHCLYLRELMQKLGRQKIIGMVDYGNRLSMNTHLRFGFRLVRRVIVAKVLGRSLVLNESARGRDVPVPGWVRDAEAVGPRAAERGERPPAPARTELAIGSAAAVRPARTS